MFLYSVAYTRGFVLRQNPSFYGLPNIFIKVVLDLKTTQFEIRWKIVHIHFQHIIGQQILERYRLPNGNVTTLLRSFLFLFQFFSSL